MAQEQFDNAEKLRASIENAKLVVKKTKDRWLSIPREQIGNQDLLAAAQALVKEAEQSVHDSAVTNSWESSLVFNRAIIDMARELLANLRARNIADYDGVRVISTLAAHLDAKQLNEIERVKHEKDDEIRDKWALFEEEVGQLMADLLGMARE